MAPGGTRTLTLDVGDWVRFHPSDPSDPHNIPDGTLARVVHPATAGRPLVLRLNLQDVHEVLRRCGIDRPARGFIECRSVNSPLAPATPSDDELAAWTIAELEH